MVFFPFYLNFSFSLPASLFLRFVSHYNYFFSIFFKIFIARKFFVFKMIWDWIDRKIGRNIHRNIYIYAGQTHSRCLALLRWRKIFYKRRLHISFFLCFFFFLNKFNSNSCFDVVEGWRKGRRDGSYNGTWRKKAVCPLTDHTHDTSIFDTSVIPFCQSFLLVAV